MRILGSTARRVVYAILITALIPLVAAIFISRTLIARVTSTAFQPEFGARLDQSLEVYADLAKAMKAQIRAEGEAIAVSEKLHRLAEKHDAAGLDKELAEIFVRHPSLIELSVNECSWPSTKRARENPVDPKTERTLQVRLSLGGGPAPETDCLGGGQRSGAWMEAIFAAPRARLDELESATAFAQAYHQFAEKHREELLDRTYANVFAALLAGTLILAVAVGVLVARPVTKRIAELAGAMRPVAEGDLSVRVDIAGKDEVAELGRAFNRMLEELEGSRARVEFLKRMSEWQKMARRLAHEIKNPLTPIQLAVEECHRRYQGDDPAYRRIVETTREVVEEEVASLRRLVNEFSSFARLPRAELREADLGAFLREQGEHLAAAEPGDGGEEDAKLFEGVELTFDIAREPMPAYLDREMLHRVLTNVVRNSAQALRDARAAEGGKGPKKKGHVRVAAKVVNGRYEVTIDDDGPGIPPAIERALFDPYVTTKRDGTGLGLTIVRKVVVDHGGSIEAGKSPLGGARFSIILPAKESPEAQAALERSAEPSGDGAPSGSKLDPPSSGRPRGPESG